MKAFHHAVFAGGAAVALLAGAATAELGLAPLRQAQAQAREAPSLDTTLADAAPSEPGRAQNDRDRGQESVSPIAVTDSPAEDPAAVTPD